MCGIDKKAGDEEDDEEKGEGEEEEEGRREREWVEHLDLRPDTCSLRLICKWWLHVYVHNLKSILTGKRFVKRSFLLSLSAVVSPGNMGIAGTLCVTYAQPVLLVSAFADVLLNWWRKCLGSLSGIPPIIWEKYMYPEILSFFELLRCVHTYVHTYVQYMHACVWAVHMRHIAVFSVTFTMILCNSWNTVHCA